MLYRGVEEDYHLRISTVVQESILKISTALSADWFLKSSILDLTSSILYITYELTDEMMCTYAGSTDTLSNK